MTSWHPDGGPNPGEPPEFPPPPQYRGYQPGPPNQYPAPPPGNGMAIAALVLGIIGFLVFGVVLGPLAIIFGAIGLSRANGGASGKGQSIAGLTLGIIDVVFAIVIIAVRSKLGLL